MPGKVKVRVLSGRQLPVMDRASDTTDAFAEVKLGDTTFKTEVCRKTLNPKWNSEWFRFDVDDLELQDEPLQIRIMDYDTYSANDAIGKVYIDLNPLLTKPEANPDQHNIHSQGSKRENMMSGWLPIFDTIHGVRGEVNVQVKVELFSDHNEFRQSSCGVPFYFSCGVPEGYSAQYINGFVEELVVNDDPEYQWIDKIRTPRASNEARQTLFLKLSGAIQRKIGLKALELGGNAVIGYQQKFDLEGDTGIVVRGIGTAVTLIKSRLPEHQSAVPRNTSSKDLCASPSELTTGTSSAAAVGNANLEGGGGITVQCDSSGNPDSQCVATQAARPLPSANLTHTNNIMDVGETGHLPKVEKPTLAHQSSKSAIGYPSYGGYQNGVQETLEYPFITIKKFPSGLIQRFGGHVSCKSVKLLDDADDDDDDTRDNWWTEIRREIRSHAKALGCNLIVGYAEDTVVSDDVVVLCASGTAAQGNLSMMLDLEAVGIYGPPFIPATSLAPSALHPPKQQPLLTKANNNKAQPARAKDSGCSQCSLVHLPYSDSINLPYNFRSSICRICKVGRVPDVLFTTVEPPPGLELIGRGCLLQAKYLCLKKDLKGENNAKEISDKLPFIEYDLHRQLINKLKVKGMNGLFGLTTKLSVSDRVVIATATATAALIAALPPPSRPRLAITSDHHHLHHANTSSAYESQQQQRLTLMQKRLEEKVAENIKYYELDPSATENTNISQISDSDVGQAESSGGNNNGATKNSSLSTNNNNSGSVTNVSQTQHTNNAACVDADLATGNKDTCVLEIDDTEDADIVDSLMDQFPPSSVQVYSTEDPVGIASGHVVNCCQTFSQVWRGKIHPSSRDLSLACKRLLSSVYFKLRRLRPCVISKMDFKADFNEENELQLSLYGTAISFSHEGRTIGQLSKGFNGANQSQRPFKGSNFFVDSCWTNSKAIVLTPLTYVPGAKVDKYLGNLNFLLIRETSSLREIGGLSSFVQWFISEVYSIVRSHVSALGGNAIVSYFMSEFVVTQNMHRNQAQCLIHVGGDAVKVSYIPFKLGGENADP